MGVGSLLVRRGNRSLKGMEEKDGMCFEGDGIKDKNVVLNARFSLI